jgi:hypothetical protein
MTNISTSSVVTTNSQTNFLTGSFSLIGNTLIKQDYSFLICERSSPTPKKPKHFLIQKVPNRKYISSLYETNNDGQFTFDFAGHKYTLTTNNQKVEIIVSP